MKLDSNTILITGGATGIGFALAQRFVQAGSEVIICGRRGQALNEAKAKCPPLHVRACNLADPEQRTDLCNWVTKTFPQLNVLVNNAGIQERIDLRNNPDWKIIRDEIDINLSAPLHLSALFIPHLQNQVNPAILNVTSGLAFSPLANTPVYSATKAALHSFTLSLRHQLADTAISVIEIIPPAVDTDLGGKGLHTFGASLDEFADSVVEQLKNGSIEATFGFSAESSKASREQLDMIFKRMNQAR